MGCKKSKDSTHRNSTDSRKFSSSRKAVLVKDIQHLALDRSGAIGSVYDARQDRFLPEAQLQIPSEYRLSKDPPHCMVNDIRECENVFDLMDIDRDLFLSLMLNKTLEDKLSPIIYATAVANQCTRILQYYYVGQEKCIPDKELILPSNISTMLKDVTPTHFVRGIKLGVLFIAVLEWSPENESHLNPLLNKITEQLKDNIFKLTPDDKALLEQVTITKVFSNLPQLCKLTKLVDICEALVRLKLDTSNHRPLQYTLQPIGSFIHLASTMNYEYIPLTAATISKIEKHLIELSHMISSLKVLLPSNEENIMKTNFDKQWNEMEQKIADTVKEYHFRIKVIRSRVYEMRSGAPQEQTMMSMQIVKYEKRLTREIDPVNSSFNMLKEKLHLIQDCKKNGITYWNVKRIINHDEHDLKTFEKRLVGKGSGLRVFYFDDKLDRPYTPQWNAFYKTLTDECKSKPSSKFIYADCTFCSYQLSRFQELQSEDLSQQQNSVSKAELSKVASSLPTASLSSSSQSTPSASKHKLSSSKSTPSSSTETASLSTMPPPKKPRVEFNFLNVLLLGESGVGKSTYINALVNYLHFESLEVARSTSPIALMPVSFLITEGHEFNERTIRFGDNDSNEDHQHLGHSVTQQCRSYVFTVDARTKLRLIDTPGMGDTRGLDQDDRNMQHILSFINNLSHLNAICILLKPNESKLTVVLRSYFTRLVGFLGEASRDKIIFCFTNTRATFFAPGNTGPLLKKMLQSDSIKGIPFGKSNTFCFDSESFRYLVARLNGVEFDDYQTEEYQRSWTTSVKESNRLLDSIYTKFEPYLQNDWQSIEHAHFQIILLTRPILETIRNTMRNIVILEEISSKSLIKLNSNPIPAHLSVCPNCKVLKSIGEFLIMDDKPQALSSGCEKCSSDLSQRAKVDYLITYEAYGDHHESSLTTLEKDRDRMKKTITYFVYFLQDLARISKENDPMLPTLDTMINEENDICLRKESIVLNAHLRDKLENLKKEHKNLWKISMTDRSPVTLSDTYKEIHRVSKDTMIKEQLDVVRQTQQMRIDEQEKCVS